LRQNAEALRINFEGYSSEVRYTDRVLRFPALFGNDGIVGLPREIGDARQVPSASPPYLTGRAVETIYTPDTSLLYSMLTGDPGDAGYFPLNAVRWLTPPREIAALVTESAKSRFAAELFSFAPEERPMAAEFYLLDPGDYQLTITAGQGEESQRVETLDFVVKTRRTRVNFELPPRQLCTLQVHPR